MQTFCVANVAEESCTAEVIPVRGPAKNTNCCSRGSHNSIHNHTREPHTTHTTPNMDMDNEIESIDNQSEEVAVAAAAAAASIMMGLIEQEAEDDDCAGAHGEEEEEEEEPKAKQRRRSNPRPKHMESA